MAKTYIKVDRYDKLKSVLVKRLASKHALSEDYIYKILSGDRENDKAEIILEEYMTAREGLLNAVKELIPFN